MRNPFKPKRIGENYLLRWHIIPRNRFFNVYLHKFIGNDDDRALHDHPWWSFSIKLKGRLREYTDTYQPGARYSLVNLGKKVPLKTTGRFYREVPTFCFRQLVFPHRLELVYRRKPVWTLFITGPRRREWGFHCQSGWVHWSKMTTPEGEPIGGCGE